TNILFIVGGAFDGLDNIIQQRIGNKVMGFGADIESKSKTKSIDVLSHLQPEDLLRYGLIPEFVGRLPIQVTLEELDVEALVRIIKEPKNALVKQYKELFKIDEIALEFEDEALELIGEKAIERKTGARGLRGIIEESMLNIMFEIPSRDDIEKCIITKDTVERGAEPTLVLSDKNRSIKSSANESVS